MRKYFWIPAAISAVIISSAFSGCIIFHKVSYEVKLETPEKGTATVTAYDMRSDAANKKDFQEDTTNLFSYMLKSRHCTRCRLDLGHG